MITSGNLPSLPVAGCAGSVTLTSSGTPSKVGIGVAAEQKRTPSLCVAHEIPSGAGSGAAEAVLAPDAMNAQVMPIAARHRLTVCGSISPPASYPPADALRA